MSLSCAEHKQQDKYKLFFRLGTKKKWQFYKTDIRDIIKTDFINTINDMIISLRII